MRPSAKSINIDAVARKIDVDNRIPLRNYYRIADNLLKQANIYRGEKNIIDLYIILLRYSSLVSETIPFHRDYQVLYPKERSNHRKKLLALIGELESLKPEFHRQVDELKKANDSSQYQIESTDVTPYASISPLEWPHVSSKSSLSFEKKLPSSTTLVSTWKQNNTSSQVWPSNSIDVQFQNLSVNLPRPKNETLSRHSFLGQTGLKGQWQGPTAEMKVHYPKYTDLTSDETSSSNQTILYDHGAVNGLASTVNGSNAMESVLSLNDGRWSIPGEKFFPPANDGRNNLPVGIIRQPSPPPVLAQVQTEHVPISPSRVADPRPGPVKPFQEGASTTASYQHLHIPIKLMEDFLRLAQKNTAKNLETCGVLAGSLKNRVFHITTLIIPKQESTSDSCQTLNEEELFEVQDKYSLFQLGWIHTHPSQTCFMSSVDLHTHYSYQVMLPEAIAIVMAPTDESSPHGIFHLSDPSGVNVMRNCQQRGFHPHEEPEDGSPLYEHCSHVYINQNLSCDVVDLR
ncbi:hypothetical protein DCAR_0935411 [Daucus carota subsp. sativus]|uniref:MPN domain-containing protein n=1 Tax=Daucus carota subsp. sativus TaxID=79200 RepID=A0AAF0XXJ5_DAUCS|nr:PREDICTED: AMSH-like ubiquitin thioesterase 3 [Daucus carota subsp. sativus]WOH15865.1 hypothetical protein DCAR_0935411 [Daucus carota subsp. sativus]